MMMSNPPSSLQSRQKLHKRQQSTPVAFEAMKVQMLPNTTQRQSLHRRGQSYDISRTPIRRHQQTGSMVGMNTNIQSFQGQQILREAQQQRTRPGQQPIQPRVDTLIAQQCGGLQQPFQEQYDMTMNAMMLPQGMMQHSQFSGMQMPLSAGVSESYMLDENNQHYFQNLHMQTAQFMPVDRRLSQPDLRHNGLRPYTPDQIQTGKLYQALIDLSDHDLASFPQPQTHFRQSRAESTSPAWQQNEIVSPRPVSMQKSRSLQGIAEHQEIEAFSEVFDAPAVQARRTQTPNAEPVKSRRPAHIKTESSISCASDASLLFGEISKGSQHLDLSSQPILSANDIPSSPTRPVLSPRRMSISDLNLEPGMVASIEETNVSLDDIAQFIDGPDPIDNKWMCNFEGCGKKFGRKENIKSHVQTHLGDRQFKCGKCDKCFVRGHDLKRHAKIHTGRKSYICDCGNAFARHDALTRHRQRGMCIGAFEGIVRKEVKRGRPKKHRPDMGDRVDKASRTRSKKITDSQDAYTSSASSCSQSSWGSPPAESMDHLSLQGDDHQSPTMSYDDTMQLFGMTSQDIAAQSGMVSMTQTSLPPNMFSFTPPASPGYSTGNKPSPTYRELTPADMENYSNHASSPQISQPMISTRSSNGTGHLVLNTTTNEVFELPQMPQIQANIEINQQTTSLPSLSHSSSPPPQDSGAALMFDFGDDSNHLRMSTMSNMSFGLSAITKSMNNDMSSDINRNEFDSFLDFNDDSQLSLGIQMGVESQDQFFANL